MGVDAGVKLLPICDKLTYEGVDIPYNLFWAHLPMGHEFYTFFDYGSLVCYYFKLLTVRLAPYDSLCPAYMAGISGKGPKVTKDILMIVQFLMKIGLTSDFAISYGIVPNGTFLGNLVLEKTIFYKWTIYYTPDETLWLFTFSY